MTATANMLLKQDLTANQLSIVQLEFEKKKKSKLIAYALWFLLGLVGGHRFYSRNPIRAIFMIVTLGGLCIWTLIDVFFIGSRIEAINDEIEAKIISEVKGMFKEAPAQLPQSEQQNIQPEQPEQTV